MELSKILHTGLIEYPLIASTKEDVISVLIERLYKSSDLNDSEEAKRAVLDREKLMSTGIGRGVALPHAKASNIEDVLVSIGVSKEGIEFDSIDGRPAYIFVLLLTPEQYPSKHIKLLSRFSKILNNAECRNELLQSDSSEKIARVFYKYDEA